MKTEINKTSAETHKTTSVLFERNKRFIKYVFWGMFLVIIILAILALIKIRKLQEENIKQKVMYENKIDSIHLADMTSMAKTFSWVMRSDLLHSNKDEAQLHLDNLLKEPHIKKAYILDAAGKILLSTDKKETGIPYADFTVINANEPISLKGENSIRIVTPIMDLNKKLGISVVEINEEN
ncbi:hypothetical protein TRIP_D450087 [uncultured Paludibacter sp.]|uniref:Uncharacterized protein n=1 Tax=uncultured Paludibacter sp. TaxID=497635 RepID=A0A653AKL1_9BACT|nr:hypothetical protein TRIP_D450087 [uncultured Paludibacter sp.]